MSAQVDVLEVLDHEIQRAGGEAYQSGRDLIESRAVVAAMIAERDALREALEKLVEAADTSDECRYGTLATGFVRDIARAALTTGESA